MPNKQDLRKITNTTGQGKAGLTQRKASASVSRREFLKLAGTMMVGSALAACAPQSALGRPTPNSGEKAQLVYQDWRTDWFPSMAQQMLEEFHATHPNIRVFYTPDPDNLEEKMPQDMAAGTAPDVVSGCCDFFPIWAQKGYLLNLQPYINADLTSDTVGEWNRAQYDSFLLPDGSRFGVPKYHGALALYYNKDLFDKYKVTYPDGSWTHVDYLAAMRQLTHDENGDGKIDLWGSMLDIAWERIQMHVNGWGGHFVDPNDHTKSLVGEPEALNAMEWIRARMWDDKVMASFLNVENVETRVAFTNQSLAMVEDGSWALKDVLVNANFRVGVAPFPRGPVKRVTLATTDGWGIYSGCKYPDAAWELVKFLISKDYGRAMAKANYLQPARQSMVGEWIDIIRKDMPEKASNMDLNAFAEGHILGYSVVAEIFPHMSEASQLAKSAWEKLYTLGQADTSIMKQVSDQIEQAQRVPA
jgi:multiple sugar transport system substrate-binding protein